MSYDGYLIRGRTVVIGLTLNINMGKMSTLLGLPLPFTEQVRRVVNFSCQV